MMEPRCTTCKGSGFIYSTGRPSQCPKCKGKGVLSLPKVSRTYKIVVVGEAWGEEEARLGMPFVGSSGRELNRMLEEAEIDRLDCYFTNVFNLHPLANDIKSLGIDRKHSTVPLPEMTKGFYLQDKYYPEVERLWKELETLQPNLVVALGNTALWALTGSYGIKGLRGTPVASVYPAGLKILPTYHPSMVLRDWSIRSIVIADLMKAKRQSSFPEVRRPARELWLEPSLNHIELFYETYVKNCKVLSFDIETVPGQITCIGFAPDRGRAIVIPFVDNRKSSGSYWASATEERLAWKLVDKYLSHASEKVGQNTLYDINWLWQKVGLSPFNYTRDTMLKHHAINPEMEKSLGFLGSIYTDEPAWKLMRGKGFGTIKRGE